MVPIVMPKAGQTMEEGVVLRWMKTEGEEVRRGEIVVEIETDKAVVELEAETAGLLRKIVVPSGQTVPVRTVLAYVGAADEEIPSSATPPEGSKPGPEPAVRQTAVQPASPGKEKANAVSPRARRLAAERGVDLSQITSTGPGGRITEQDVENWVAHSKPLNRSRVLSKRQISLGETLQRSMQAAPHFSLSANVKVDEVLRTKAAIAGELRPTLTSYLVKAVGLALNDCPEINCRWEEDGLVYNDFVNVGIAVDAEGELLRATLVDVTRKNVSDLAADSRSLIMKAKQGKLASHPASITISNLGPFGVHQFTAIINPPEIAILAVGEVVSAVEVSDTGKVNPIKQMTLTLSCDHRALNGAQSAHFLKRVKGYLEAPAEWSS